MIMEMPRRKLEEWLRSGVAVLVVAYRSYSPVFLTCGHAEKEGHAC